MIATMLQKEDKPFRTNLEAAIAYLIGKGIIKKDADVVAALRMSKGTLSAYKSGKTIPSKNFIQEFENFYKIKLDDFSLEENSLEEHDHGYTVLAEGTSELELLRQELEQLKASLSDKDALIRSQQKIIELQERILNQEEKSDGHDKENDGQGKRSA